MSQPCTIEKPSLAKRTSSTPVVAGQNVLEDVNTGFRPIVPRGGTYLWLKTSSIALQTCPHDLVRWTECVRRRVGRGNAPVICGKYLYDSQRIRDGNFLCTLPRWSQRMCSERRPGVPRSSWLFRGWTRYASGTAYNMKAPPYLSRNVVDEGGCAD